MQVETLFVKELFSNLKARHLRSFGRAKALD
jgi:hypothetical protein